MFKKFFFIVSLCFLGAGSVKSACYTDGINFFEEEKYQEAFDIMRPMAEKGSTYVVAYLEYIKDNKLIKNTEFNMPVNIPCSLLRVSKDWLKASLLYIRIRRDLDDSKDSEEALSKIMGKVKRLYKLNKECNFRAFVVLSHIFDKKNKHR